MRSIFRRQNEISDKDFGCDTAESTVGEKGKILVTNTVSFSYNVFRIVRSRGCKVKKLKNFVPILDLFIKSKDTKFNFNRIYTD